MTLPTPPAPTTDPPVPAPDSVVVPTLPPPPAPTIDPRLFQDPNVQAAIEAARAQERGKLNEDLERLRREQSEHRALIDTFSSEREQLRQAQETAAREQEAAAEAARQAELTQQQQFSEQLEQMRAQQEQMRAENEANKALVAQERAYTELMDYRSRALQERGQEIMPQLRDFVTGNTPEEIDASVSALVERSGSILGSVAEAQGLARTQSRGVSVTAPPVGPSDTDTGYETVSAEQIRGMSMSDYAKNRGRLLGAAANQSQQGQGMFG